MTKHNVDMMGRGQSLTWREIVAALWIVTVFAVHLRLMLEFLRMLRL